MSTPRSKELRNNRPATQWWLQGCTMPHKCPVQAACQCLVGWMLGFTQPHTIGEAVANRSLQPSRAIQDHLLTDKPGDTRSDANTQPTGHRYNTNRQHWRQLPTAILMQPTPKQPAWKLPATHTTNLNPLAEATSKSRDVCCCSHTVIAWWWGPNKGNSLFHHSIATCCKNAVWLPAAD
jgi:hypothetical protein